MENILSPGLEDYLEVICNYEIEGQQIRAIDIANTLNISRASVSEGLQKLSAKGLITYNKNITLTNIGKTKANLIVSKHTILQKFFEEVLGLEKKDASENACKIEHIISETAFNKIKEFLNK